MKKIFIPLLSNIILLSSCADTSSNIPRQTDIIEQSEQINEGVSRNQKSLFTASKSNELLEYQEKYPRYKAYAFAEAFVDIAYLSLREKQDLDFSKSLVHLAIAEIEALPNRYSDKEVLEYLYKIERLFSEVKIKTNKVRVPKKYNYLLEVAVSRQFGPSQLPKVVDNSECITAIASAFEFAFRNAEDWLKLGNFHNKYYAMVGQNALVPFSLKCDLPNFKAHNAPNWNPYSDFALRAVGKHPFQQTENFEILQSLRAKHLQNSLEYLDTVPPTSRIRVINLGGFRISPAITLELANKVAGRLSNPSNLDVNLDQIQELNLLFKELSALDKVTIEYSISNVSRGLSVHPVLTKPNSFIGQVWKLFEDIGWATPVKVSNYSQTTLPYVEKWIFVEEKMPKVAQWYVNARTENTRLDAQAGKIFRMSFDQNETLKSAYTKMSDSDKSVLLESLKNPSTKAMTTSDSPHGQFWSMLEDLGWATEYKADKEALEIVPNLKVWSLNSKDVSKVASWLDNYYNSIE